jgi:hypothetical protein
MHSLLPDLRGVRAYQFLPTVSPGLQEYVEALAFAHFLQHGTLISLDEVQATLCVPSESPSKEDVGPGRVLVVGLDDYLLGVSDVTGELMRYAIGAIGRRGGRGTAKEVSEFVRNCKAGERYWCGGTGLFFWRSGSSGAFPGVLCCFFVFAKFSSTSFFFAFPLRGDWRLLGGGGRF